MYQIGFSFPRRGGGEDYWCQHFSDSEKEQLFSHMKSCHQCREAEIEATLRWAELRPRATRMELIESLQNSSQHSRILPFDEYPEYLLEHILHYTKGQIITFSRNEDGNVTKITGKTDHDIESECMFIHEASTTSIHCYCHNCEDDSEIIGNRMTFADFHIDFSKQLQINYTSDITDFYPESKEIQRYHTTHKIFTNDHNSVIKIMQDKKLLYEAIYDNDFNLTKELRDNITTEYGYLNNKRIFKKVYSDEGIIEHFNYDYVENIEIPVRIFTLNDNYPQLYQLNTVLSSANEQTKLDLEFDGVTRAYFNHKNLLIMKVCLPNDNRTSALHYDVANLKEVCGKIDTIEVVLVDTKTKATRILKKVDRCRNIDQTATYRNGQLVKIYNHKDAVYTSIFRTFFSKCDVDV